ncbi:MAG: hypothetical protein AB7O65_01520, partial [Candidatus Korobacteraceae bacterium]
SYQRNVVSTTTLARETGNNTSAANSFKDSVNGNLGSGNISKVPVRSLLYPGATTRIYTHVVPWWGKKDHISVGYSSHDRNQVGRQVEDMISRGIDGVIIDWYGPGSFEDLGSKLFFWEAEERSGFGVIIEIEHGAVKWHSCYPDCDATTAVIELTEEVAQRFFTSPAYIRHNGRPVVMEFGMENLASPVDWAKVQAAYPEIIWIHRNPPGYTRAKSGGAFAWWDSRTPDKLTAGYDSSSYLDYYYKVAAGYPQLLTYGSVFKGFDDSMASWSPPGGRRIYQSCGQTWLKSFAVLNKWYSAGNPLYAMQLNTWNDYEEGSELETGIDNCVKISAKVTNGVLTWSIEGQENTIHHYTVFISADGQNLMPLGEFTPGTRSLTLASFGMAPGTYKLFVQAVGQPLIRNQMAAAVSYVTPGSSPAASQQGQSSSHTPSSPSSSQRPASSAALPDADDGAAPLSSAGSTTTVSSAKPRPAKKLDVKLSPAKLTLKRGGSGAMQLALATEENSAELTLACDNLPAGVSCAFAPAKVTTRESAATATVTISTNAPSAKATSKTAALGSRSMFALITPGLGVAGVFFAGLSRRRLKVLTGTVLLLAVVSLIGCGGGQPFSSAASASQAAPSGTYDITITAASNSVQQSVTATLVLE